MIDFQKKRKLPSEFEKGFSLLELLVAMVIFIIVSASIYGLLQVGAMDKNRSSRRADLMKNARTALHLIGRDALNAGLSYHQRGAVVPDDFLENTLGLPADGDTERDMLTSVLVGNDLFTNDLQNDPTKKTDLVAFAYRDMNFNNGNIIGLDQATQGTGSSTTRLTSTNTDIVNANRYDLYLVESDSSQVAVMATQIIDNRNIDFAPNDPLGLNQAWDGTGVDRSLLNPCTSTVSENCTTYENASMKRFFWVSYRVKQDGTFVRTIYGNNVGQPATAQIREQPLAYNVKDLQFKYLLSDGRVTDNPTAGPDGINGNADDTPFDSNLITQLSVTLEVQSTQMDEQTQTFHSIKLNATFSIRNLQYDAG